jgi:hypothetical protein
LPNPKILMLSEDCKLLLASFLFPIYLIENWKFRDATQLCQTPPRMMYSPGGAHGCMRPCGCPKSGCGVHWTPYKLSTRIY